MLDMAVAERGLDWRTVSLEAEDVMEATERCEGARLGNEREVPAEME